jgi:hypothetical protein
MRFLSAVVIGVLLGAGTVLALAHDNSAVEPAPMRAMFQNLAPYKPPPLPSPPAPAPSTRSQFNYGSGG